MKFFTRSDHEFLFLIYILIVTFDIVRESLWGLPTGILILLDFSI